MKLINGDCLEVLKQLEDNSIDAVVCDPPYHLTSGRTSEEIGHPSWNSNTKRTRAGKKKGFMGKEWDGVDENGNGIAYNVELWKECLRVLKPGGHLLAFGGTRTYHRMAVAIEDAGFEVRDMLEWIYASGFPKSLNVGKAVDKLQGNEREVVGDKLLWGHNAGSGAGSFSKNQYEGQTGVKRTEPLTKGNSKWEGFGTALKPSHEPIILCRKPLAKVYLYELFEMYGFNYYITTSTATEGTKRYKSYIDKGFEPVTENIDEIRERITAQVEKKYEDDVDGLIDYEQEIEDKILKATPKKVFRFETKLATNPSVESIWTIETIKGKETIKTEKYKKIWKNNNVVNCLKHGTGAICIDGCRIPTSDTYSYPNGAGGNSFSVGKEPDGKRIEPVESNTQGRFPANIICTDDALNDGVMTKSGSKPGQKGKALIGSENGETRQTIENAYGDNGSKSRYFDLDVWAEKHGLLQFPKASKRERNEGCEGLEEKEWKLNHLNGGDKLGLQGSVEGVSKNNHPTVKPVHLMSWLVRLVSKEGDTVLDPFMGSGTTGVACRNLGRNFIGIELSEEYLKIAEARINQNRLL